MKEDKIMLKNTDSTSHSRDIAITLLHVIGMIMIFLCHSMQAEKIYFLSEIFISGVPLFLFLSGFLAGKREIDNVGKWWLGKLKRVLIPFWIFIVLMYGVYEITGLTEVSPFQWIFTLCNFQGLNYTYWRFNCFGAVSGCGHLWFITSLMFCYLLTPLMQKFKKIVLKVWQKVLLIIAVLVIQLILMYLGFQFSYIITFFFGYFVSGKKVRSDFLWFGFVTVLTVSTGVTRLILKRVIDGSDFYDRYFALISSALIAAWIFYAVYFIKDKMPKLFCVFDCKVLAFTEKASYYFYLTHYMFLSGVLSVFRYVENRVLAHILAFAFSYISSIIMLLIVEKGLFRILKRSKV